MIEHELFGYVKGAFPGALRNVPGVLASAERGTVFLDEIGQLTPDLQGKLLRVLQEKEIRPAGATHRIPLHARILAASSRGPGGGGDQGNLPQGPVLPAERGDAADSAAARAAQRIFRCWRRIFWSACRARAERATR